MVLAKSKKSVGLGNTLMNDRFGKGKGTDRKRVSAVTRIDHATGKEYITNDKQDAAWVKMRSITEQGALDEFLATAELAGTDFTAEKMNNVKIIHTDQRNPYLLSAKEEQAVLGKQKENKNRLTVPRRPKWDSTTTREELDQLERESFLEWRRGLAELQETQDLLMTPFERNLEVWRQLWRVIERSDVIVQIVDARNPLMFRSEDLEVYVKDIDPKKQNLLLINKADLMTYKQRKMWANYLKGEGIDYRFFSAQLAKEMIEAGEYADSDEEEDSDDESDAGEGPSEKEEAPKAEEKEEAKEEEATEENDPDTHILRVDELEDILLQYQPKDQGKLLLHDRTTNQTNTNSIFPQIASSRSVSSVIPTSVNLPPSTLSSAPRRCPSPPLPARRSISRPSTSATTSSFAIVPVSSSPTSPTPRPSSSATVSCPLIRCASTPAPPPSSPAAFPKPSLRPSTVSRSRPGRSRKAAPAFPLPTSFSTPMPVTVAT